MDEKRQEKEKGFWGRCVVLDNHHYDYGCIYWEFLSG